MCGSLVSSLVDTDNTHDRRNEVQSQPAPAVARDCTLMWIRTKLPMHAVCLDWNRFGRSRQEAHAVSCTILHKVTSGLLLFEMFITSQLGS